MIDAMSEQFERLLPDDLDHCSIRYMRESLERVSVRQDILEPVHTSTDNGVLVTVWHRGGEGYAATSDLSDEGILDAVARATEWSRRTAGIGVVESPPTHHSNGSYHSAVSQPWAELSLSDRIDLVTARCAALDADSRIVDRVASIDRHDVDMLLVTTGGTNISQEFRNTYPGLRAVAHESGVTQIRTFGNSALAQRGGLEVLDRLGYTEASVRLAEEAVELLSAPNCPSDVMDVILSSDQMALQIHESIGHPLELDRILGDERNFAGTSFVTTDMFGSYQYGSDLLNVTFDPTIENQVASYAFDDEGTPARKHHLIRNGILERPLGGAISQTRAGMEGVANSRSSAWNRAPIDRMANLNVEPGNSSFRDLVSGIERGIYLETNSSWSIDDSRNKFQFGCERGTLIEDGELTSVVRNPSYRGISSSFWRSLAGVGDASTNRVMGVPTCGKGEPSQVIWVGHASPPCLFTNVDVFGGES